MTGNASESTKPTDQFQQLLTRYAGELSFTELDKDTIHAAKVRTLDTLGVLIAGFFAEPCRISREVAMEFVNPRGATLIGTRIKTTPDMAAFVNGTAARYLELTDSYHWPGSFGGHPSDVIAPVLSAAEYAHASGRDLITAIVLAYEIFLRIDDVFHNYGFDQTTFSCLATAAAAGRLFGLDAQRLSHALSLAIVPNNALRLSRMGYLSMWKCAASGQAGRSGVFAAQLARAGMDGPHMPFEGKSGWFDHVAVEKLTLQGLARGGEHFKILDTSLKFRPSVGLGIATILATEKIAPINIREVKEIKLEISRKAKGSMAGPQHWNPDSKETADHSAPYLVVTALKDGTITPKSYDDAHLRDPAVRALMQRVSVVENDEFTRAYEGSPTRHVARVTAVMNSGERLIGETGGGSDELDAPKTDAQVEQKFRSLTEDHLGSKRANAVLEQLWKLEEMANVDVIPPLFSLD